MASISWRALILGALLSMVVAMYSSFAGLQAGGVYWPIVTTSLISMAVLKALGRTDSSEINVMQTAASTGGLLAAGVIFTLPVALLLGLKMSIIDITVVSLVGGMIGIVFTIPLRRQMIERENLPYADGAAAASMIKAGDQGGKKAALLLITSAASAFYALLKDAYAVFAGFPKIIEPVVGIQAKIGAANVFLASLTSVIPFAGGFLIGPKFTGAWFLGTIAGIALLAMQAQIFGTAVVNYELGIGIIMGASIAYFIFRGVPILSGIVKSWKEAKTRKWEGLALILSVGALTIITNLNVALSVLALVGSFVMAFVAARVTGKMNIDPLEVFALIIMLVAKVALGFSALPLVILSAVVAIAAGMAGDFMQDLKSGHLLKTKPEHQVIAQIVGLVAASAVMGFTLLSLNQTFHIGSPILPAPQALALKGLIEAPGLSASLITGLVVGAVLLLLSEYVLNWGLVPIAFGIGLYVPMALSLPLFVGGMIRLYAERSGKGKALEQRMDKARVTAAGLIAGAGLVGVLLSIYGFLKSLLIFS